MQARTLAKSDTKNDSGFNMLMVVTTPGSVVIGNANGSTTTLASVPIGVWVPAGLGAVNIAVASTAVGFLVA